MVTEALNMSLASKREYLAKIQGRYQRAGRPHKSRILDEFCLNCGYHRKAVLRLLNWPMRSGPRKRSGPKIIYDSAELPPVLKPVWLASEQLCGKLLKAALPEWLDHYERRNLRRYRRLLRKNCWRDQSGADGPVAATQARAVSAQGAFGHQAWHVVACQQIPTRGGPP